MSKRTGVFNASNTLVMGGIVGDGCRAGAPEIGQLFVGIVGEMDANGERLSTANGRQWTRIGRGFLPPMDANGREWGGLFIANGRQQPRMGRGDCGLSIVG
ncbi:MAG: hypothetical protein RI897_2478 [Verrucomicrobiota bacterium]